MHELHSIASLVLAGLRGLGVMKLDEHWDDHAFGSGLIVLGRAQPEVRLAWDGRDAWAYLQARGASGEWSDISGPIAEGDFHLGEPSAEKIRSMVEAGLRALGRRETP